MVSSWLFCLVLIVMDILDQKQIEKWSFGSKFFLKGQ